MSTFVRAALADAAIEEETFSPLEQLTITQEGVEIVHRTDIAIAQYEAIVESAQSLETLSNLAHENPTSLESLSVPFEVASAGHLRGDLSLEGIGSFLRKIWDAIVKAWNKVKEMVMKLINWLTGRGGKSQKDTVKDAQRSLDKDDKIEAESDPKETKEVADKFTKSLAKREKELNEAAKKVSSASGADELIDSIPTSSFEEFDEFMSEDTSKKSTEVSAKDHAKELEASIDATEDAAKQYEKTIKARDDLQKAIDKSVSKLDVKDDNAMAAAFRELQSGPEVKAGKVLNFAAKKNTKDVKKVATLKDIVEERSNLLKAKVSTAFMERRDDILEKLKKNNKVYDEHESETLTVKEVMLVRVESNGKVQEHVALIPIPDYYGMIKTLTLSDNGEVVVRGTNLAGLPDINTRNQTVKEAMKKIPNIMIGMNIKL